MSKIADIDLHGQLTVAQRRLSELSANLEHLRTSARERRAALVQAEIAAKEEAETALIDNRQPDHKLVTTAETLTAEIADTEKQVTTAEGACNRQRGVIEQIRSEISATAYRRMAAINRPMFDEAFKHLEQAAILYERITAVSRAEGQWMDAHEFQTSNDHFDASGHNRLAWLQHAWQMANLLMESGEHAADMRARFGRDPKTNSTKAAA